MDETTAKSYIEEVFAWLHAHPELSYEEHETTTKLKELLSRNRTDLFLDVVQKQGFTLQEAPKSLGGEDFAYYQEKLPGVFASIGTGLSAPNHNPKFKVDPSAIAARCKTSGSYCRRSTKEACKRCLSSAVLTIRLGESGQKDYLANNLPKARLIEPEGTYLIWIDFSAYNLPDEVLDDLIINKGSVWLDSAHIFGTGGQGFQRVNIACPWQVLSDGLSRLSKALNNV